MVRKAKARLARGLTTMIVAGVMSAVALSSGAQAGTFTTEDYPNCPFTRTLCLWDGTMFTGERFAVQAQNPTVGTCVDLAAHGWPNGRAKSGYNTGTRTARLYTTTNCTGNYYQIIPGGRYSSINFNSNSVYVY